MHDALRKVSHRPWTLPAGDWTWRQSWCDLLFAHWPVSKEILRPLVPEPLEVQEFDGTSWIGVVPFRMEGVMRRPFPDLPWISAFPELNLRVYVEFEGKPGVWFLSLDATNWLAVMAARKFFHLPYYRADISIHEVEGQYRYKSVRSGSNSRVEFEGVYNPASEAYTAASGTLEHWLTERYCLYALSPDGDIFRTEVHHHPWPLQKAKAAISKNEIGAPFGIKLSDEPALLHFSKKIDVVIWNPEKLHYRS